MGKLVGKMDAMVLKRDRKRSKTPRHKMLGREGDVAVEEEGGETWREGQRQRQRLL
jgi:hypothetical protein